MNAPKTLFAAAIALALLGAGCGKDSKPLPTTPAPQAPSQNVDQKPTGIPSPSPIDANSSSTVVDNPTGSDVKNPIVYPVGANPLRPRPVGEICDPQNFMCTSASLVYSEVSPNFSVTGTGVAFENTINWRIEVGGKKITEGNVMASAPDVGQPGPFTIAVKDLKAETGAIELVIFEYSAKDGTPIHELRIPLRLKK